MKLNYLSFIAITHLESSKVVERFYNFPKHIIIFAPEVTEFVKLVHIYDSKIIRKRSTIFKFLQLQVFHSLIQINHVHSMFDKFQLIPVSF